MAESSRGVEEARGVRVTVPWGVGEAVAIAVACSIAQFCVLCEVRVRVDD